MYTINVKIKGISPLLQHRFPVPKLEDLGKGATKQTGASITDVDRWQEYLYMTKDGEIYQPASHIEGALVKAATSFKIQGKGRKTYKDLFRATVFVQPEQILHGMYASEELDTDADKPLYLDMRPVKIGTARIVRIRPAFKAGWELEFQIEVLDDSIAPELVNDILTLAGRTVGIGDYRPKFGRFMVTKFEVVE